MDPKSKTTINKNTTDRNSLKNILSSNSKQINHSIIPYTVYGYNIELKQELKETKRKYTETEANLLFNNIIINLLHNSLWSITGIKTYKEFLSSRPKSGTIKLITFSDKNYDIFTISDTGCGMTKEQVKQIFSQKFSTKSSRGIGLPIVLETLRKTFNGNIKIITNPKKGTTFIIKIPLR